MYVPICHNVIKRTRQLLDGRILDIIFKTRLLPGTRRKFVILNFYPVLAWQTR